MPFLYFPEDKSEYIPAAISFTIFMILMIITYRWILKISKKQEAESKKIEERVMREREENMQHTAQHSHDK
ncbi:hypothetical protein IRY55_10605 [Savagea sp. SN6]|uniref:Uncharacterized protein n=1 Tax=Savagea serpentis TaxID=2785297 RepID=A0A8J7G5K3_9BACL|nr:hypothetical protein [Savagea serpentis]MBF4501812.1 hypothetical protein [Savagea serpentis]